MSDKHEFSLAGLRGKFQRQRFFVATNAASAVRVLPADPARLWMLWWCALAAVEISNLPSFVAADVDVFNLVVGADAKILTYKDHGPIVTEEWWALGAGPSSVVCQTYSYRG